MAQLYQQEFKTQEKAKYEHIKKAKEKAIEEQRKLEEEHKQKLERERQEAINQSREKKRKNATVQSNNNSQDTNNSKDRVQTTEPAEQASGSTIGNNWSQVSPNEASQYISTRTGVPVSTWQAIIYAESTNNPTVTNSIGCFGYLQLNPVHGNVSSMTPQQYLDTAVSVYNSQGLSAWEVVTLGIVK